MSTPATTAPPAQATAAAEKKKKGKKKKSAAKTTDSAKPAQAVAGAPAKSAVEAKTTTSGVSAASSAPAADVKTAAAPASSAQSGSAVSSAPVAAPAETKAPAEAYISADGKVHEVPVPLSVPNVVSKASEKEQARMQAQVGNLRKVGGIFVADETKETKKFETKERETDLKKIPAVYIKNCSDGHYHIAQRTVKVLIEGCKNTTVILEGEVLTRTVEVWKCDNFTLQINTQVKTLQLDISKNMRVQYEKKEHFGAIVWANIEDTKISFGDAKEHDLDTGFTQMLKEHPDSNVDVDQFIVRFLDDSKLTTERCVRLKNGHLSTEREALEWEKRNAVIKQQFVDNFLKEAGIHLKKAKDAPKKVDRNADCPCGSGKKYKKCCANKTELTGTEEVKKAIV